MLFTSELVDRVKSAIRSELSARHVPMCTYSRPLKYRSVIDPLRSIELHRDWVELGTDGMADQTTVNLKKVELPMKKTVRSIRHANSAIGDPAQPGQSGLLLSIRRYREAGEQTVNCGG